MWQDRREAKKGALGEAIIDKWLLSRNIIPYQPVADCAHPFDRFIATRDKKNLAIVEVKSKPKRTYYPDTGIDISKYGDYTAVSTKYNMPLFLIFVDEKEKAIYGNYLAELEKPRQISVRGQSKEYPSKENGIIYFPIAAMVQIAKLTDEQAGELFELRVSDYDSDMAEGMLTDLIQRGMGIKK